MAAMVAANYDAAYAERAVQERHAQRASCLGSRA